MPRKIISLNDSLWEFGSVAQKPFGEVDDLAEVREWLPASVPGDVRLDLMRAGKITDPFIGFNNEQSQWVDARDWWYRRAVELNLSEDERAFLVFDGIDYQSAGWVDGVCAGRHTGMFSRQIYELLTTNCELRIADCRLRIANGTRNLHPVTRHSSRVTHLSSATRHSSHSLAIRIWGSDALPKMKLSAQEKVWKPIATWLMQGQEAFPDRLATLKTQMSFGWDFAPRLRTCGIWDEARVVVVKRVLVEDVWVKGEIQNSKFKIQNSRVPEAKVKVVLALDSDRDQAVQVVLNTRGRNFSSREGQFAFELNLTRGKSEHALSFGLNDARVWNPWDRGEPNLYELCVEVFSREDVATQAVTPALAGGARVASEAKQSPARKEEIASSQKTLLAMTRAGQLREEGQSLDTCETTFGIRDVTLEQNPGAPRDSAPWTFVLNGAREFIRGANWVPPDAIPGRVTREDYAALIRLAREANVNLLRVWGGGLKEKRAFYDLCDEQGILVWQEFPFSVALLDHFPQDAAYLSYVRAECGAIVRALRNHPSVVLWCGGNEFNTRTNRAVVDTLRAVVETHDGTRPFKPASPSRGDSHNWRVWHGFANTRDYKKDRALFMSEFGLQAAPEVESLEKFLEIRDWQAWKYHHAEMGKLRRYVREVSGANEFATIPPKSAGQANTPSLPAQARFVEATQQAQAYGLQIAIEHARRNKPRVGGCAFWQFNDAWGAISWSVLDYYRVPKRAYTKIKQVYNPLLVSFDYPLKRRRTGDKVRGTVFIVNDWNRALDPRVRAVFNGRAIFETDARVDADAVVRVGELEIELEEGENVLRFEVDGELNNEYDLNYCDVGESSWLARLYSAVGEWLKK